MPNSDLERLREIRDQQRASEALLPERDRLIRGATGNRSIRQLARAAGLSPSRIHQIISSSCD